MTAEELATFTKEFGVQAATEMKTLAEAAEKRLNDAFTEFKKGAITTEQFEEVKKEVKEGNLKELNEKLEKLEEVSKNQGELINAFKENGGRQKQKSLEEFFEEQMPKILEMRKAQSGFIEITGKMLKDAGVTSITGSIGAMDPTPGTSPYLPGIGGAELALFDIARNPNFILNHVNVGRTNQSRLAWINETAMEGAVDTNIAEGSTKPLTQHKFVVEFSVAKKAAAYIELTEEFDTDVPGLATAVRRMLAADVIRAFDDAVQANVIAVARPYEITELDDQIQDANLWSALRAMIGQVGHYNFIANTIGVNPLTAVAIDESKNANGTYLIPPFMARIQGMMIEANKVAYGFAFVGDLTQYNVDIYKDFTMRVGWINDQLITNQFCVLGELRYHSYISDNRKKAICYDNLHDVKETIDAAGSQ